MPEVVYTRARAHVRALLIYKTTTTTTTPIYNYTYTLHLLGFGRVILVSMRRTAIRTWSYTAGGVAFARIE